MSVDITITQHDTEVYKGHLEGFLPPRLIDIHAHVWLAAHGRPAATPGRTVTWPQRVAASGPIEDLEATYRLLFPGRVVLPLIFSNVNVHLDAANAYCAACAVSHDCRALLFSDPAWSAAELAARLDAGPFVGVKAYLSWAPAYLPADEIRIFDFFPHAHLEVLNERRLIAMVHVPRPGRLGDPVNLAQLLEIDRRYPELRCIVAHVGRAYCWGDVGEAFAKLGASENLFFDISANTNARVFAELLRTVGPERVLFGSDLPITRMRMRRVCEAGRYVNLVPPGLYGDLSGDPHMREVDSGEKLTFFLYEELLALRAALDEVGLGREAAAAICYGNAARILGM